MSTCGARRVPEMGGMMVHVGPEMWERHCLGDRGGRQPPQHASTPRNQWGGVVWGSWRKNGPCGILGTGEGSVFI